MLKDEWPSLFPMTLSAALIETRHGQTAGMLKDIRPVRVMALHAVHLAFNHGMMLGQTELRLRLQMALETGARVLSGIHNEFAASAAGLDVLAAGAVTGLTPGLADHLSGLNMDTRMRTGRKHAGDIGVTIIAGAIADEGGAGNLRRRHNGARDRGAGVQEQSAGCDQGEQARQNQYSLNFQSRFWRHFTHVGFAAATEEKPGPAQPASYCGQGLRSYGLGTRPTR